MVTDRAAHNAQEAVDEGAWVAAGSLGEATAAPATCPFYRSADTVVWVDRCLVGGQAVAVNASYVRRYCHTADHVACAFYRGAMESAAGDRTRHATLEEAALDARRPRRGDSLGFAQRWAVTGGAIAALLILIVASTITTRLDRAVRATPSGAAAPGTAVAMPSAIPTLPTSQSASPTAVAIATEETREASPMPNATAATPTRVAVPSVGVPTVPAEAARVRLIAAEAGIATGEFVSTITYDTQTWTTQTIRFDLGRAGGSPQMQSTVTYHSVFGTRTTEVVTIGGRTRQRAPGGPWAAIDRADSTVGQVRALLPRADAAVIIAAEERGGATVLRWYDAGEASDVEVELATASGTPQRMERRSRADGSVLTVTYRSWNTPVVIDAPRVT